MRATPEADGWTTTCHHCDWSTWRPTLTAADRAHHTHQRDKHPKETR